MNGGLVPERSIPVHRILRIAKPPPQSGHSTVGDYRAVLRHFCHPVQSHRPLSWNHAPILFFYFAKIVVTSRAPMATVHIPVARGLRRSPHVDVDMTWHTTPPDTATLLMLVLPTTGGTVTVIVVGVMLITEYLRV